MKATQKFLVYILTCIICIGLISSSSLYTEAAIHTNDTAYGFNTHLYVNSTDMNLTDFKEVVDEIALLGLTNPYIRFQLENVDLFPRTDLTSSDINCDPISPVNCNPTNLDIFDEAIQYTETNGVDIYLILVVPYWAKYYSPSVSMEETVFSRREYKNITKKYLNEVVGRWENEVDHWQIFNESNHHAFDSYDAVDYRTNSAYRKKLNKTLKHIGNYFTANYPNEVTSISAGGWPVNNNLFSDYYYFFDRVGQYTDTLAIGLYPDDNQTEIDLIPTRITDMENRYGQPVDIAETGMCIDVVRFDESDQVNYIPQYLDKITQGGANTAVVYQYRDNPYLAGPCENTFGLQQNDGTHKLAYTPVINYMQNN